MTPRITFLPTEEDRAYAKIADPVSQILFDVAKKHEVQVPDILGENRTRRVSWARQEVYFRLRHERGLSFPVIARITRRKDHTTVMSGVDALKRRLQQAKDE